MASSSVLFLQEMSRPWTGAAYGLCQEAGYTLIPALYGRRFNGYMGVAVAVPNDKYRILDVDVQRVADSRDWPKAEEAIVAPPSPCIRFLTWPLRFMSALVKFIGRETGITKLLFTAAKPNGKAPMSAEEVWKEALRRENDMVCVRLEDRATGGRLCVATYHMPCVFWSPPVMMIHTALAVQHAQVCVRLCASVYVVCV